MVRVDVAEPGHVRASRAPDAEREDLERQVVGGLPAHLIGYSEVTMTVRTPSCFTVQARIFGVDAANRERVLVTPRAEDGRLPAIHRAGYHEVL